MDDNGEYHFDDACAFPARISGGVAHYYLHGVPHRADGPAEVHPNGSESWFFDGRYHRDDGPADIAIDEENIIVTWYQHDLLHRIDGPAIVDLDKSHDTIILSWWRGDKKHNSQQEIVDGTVRCRPAYMKFKISDFPAHLLEKFQSTHDLTNGDIFDNLDELDYPNAIEMQWWIDDKLHNTDAPAIVYRNGTEMWYQSGKLHRDDGPAITKFNGYKAWFLNGERHRKNGPAIVDEFGTQIWYKYGACHRKDGPAMVRVDGREEWFVRGIAQDRGDLPNVTWPDGQQQWVTTFVGELSDECDERDESVENPGTYHLLHRSNGPAVVFPDGREHYYYKGKLHSQNDLPAIEYDDGAKVYCKHGEQHRVVGPAVIGGVRSYEYWQNGKRTVPDDPDYIKEENDYVCKRLCCRQKTPGKGLE